jgi:AcrR family transcriptional regulator
LRIVGFDYRFCDIDGRSRPKHWTVGPGIRGVDDYAQSIIRRILQNDGSHLLKNARADFLLLVLEILLSILRGALQRLLFLFNLPGQVALGIFIHARALGAELFLESIDGIVLSFEVVALRLELLAESFEVALAFVAAEDGVFNIDGAKF